MTVMLNGDQIYTEELIRENARLTVGREADRLRIEELTAQLEDCAAPLSDEQAAEHEARMTAQQQRFDQAVEVIHKLMSGADRCLFCGRTKECKMGDDCRPLWKGADK